MSLHLFLGFMAAVLLAAGVLCLTVAWRARERERKAASVLTRATGTIVKLKTQRRGSGDYPGAYPVVEFTTSSGERVTVTSHYSNQDRLAQQVGDRVVVQYDPSDPKRAEIAGAARRGDMVIIVAGAIFLLLGMMVMTAALGRSPTLPDPPLELPGKSN
jgi:hypothetical protein